MITINWRNMPRFLPIVVGGAALCAVVIAVAAIVRDLLHAGL